jgi:hypothetical protein
VGNKEIWVVSVTRVLGKSGADARRGQSGAERAYGSEAKHL